MEPTARLRRGRDLVPLREAARTWFGISLQSFGGPAAQIAVMHRRLVDEKRWIGERRFLHALNFCTLLPGPEAQQLAIYCGWLLNGTAGGLIAGSLFVLPGFVVLLVVSLLYAGFGDTLLVASIFAGVAPAVLPIVVQAVQRVSKRALTNLVSRVLAIAAFVALFAFNVPFPIVVGSALLFGWLGGRLRPAWFVSSAAHGSEDSDAPAPLIADDALHGASRSLPRAAFVLAAGLAAWGVPVALLGIWQGTDSTLFEMATFFSLTAVVTFGGAYAVLSYIGQRAVNVYGWLRPGEMATALALAETTPGPLIQLVQFVAFVGAYRQPGSLNPWVAGLVATVVVVWVTYVPCFLWIFLGAPYVEALRQNQGISHALNAVTAAVVGVIANLAAFFALHALFDRVDDGRHIGVFEMSVPHWSSLDWRAVAVAAFAAIGLFRARWAVARTVVVAGGAGSVLYFLT
jgi:chromate transporter